MSAKQQLFPILLGGLLSAATVSHAKIVRPQKTPPENLHFVENKGQVTDQFGNPRNDINFRIGGKGLGIFVGNAQLHYQWSVSTQNQPSAEKKQKTAMYRMDVALLGADPQAAVVTENKQDFHERYYLNGEQANNAYAYQKITYKEVYPNIDWVLYVKDNSVEYDFVVRPGGNVSDIRLQYRGATKLAIDETGRLTATTPMGSVTENAPASFQEDGKKIGSRFVLQGNVLSFATATHSGTLIIDPTLSWATYYGGSGDDISRAGNVTGDNSGNAYLSGNTSSTTNIATTGSYKDTVTVAVDAFLVKFNSSGVRQWATYYGGEGDETVYGLACDLNSNVYLSGYTTSTYGIATTGAFQTTIGSQDAFIAKFDSTGSRLWATYYGGSANEQGLGITCDRANNVYLTGYTQSSSSISTSGSQQPSIGGSSDAFIVKFNSAGTRLWASYYGGSSADQGWSVACDSNKNVYLSGYTQSASGIATTGAHQTTIGGGQDGFLVKFDSAGVRQWATYYGGTTADRALSAACDKSNNVYITGYSTSSGGIATTGAHQTTFGGVADAFIAKFNTGGTRQWGTYYGNIGDDESTDITCDELGHIYLVGFTNSNTSIATAGAFKDTLDFQDAFLVKFDTAGVRIWGTYFGGENGDLGYGVYCSPLSKVYISGTTTSLTNLATGSSHQTTYGGGTFDAFIAKFDDCQLTAPSAITGNDSVCRNSTNTYSVPAVTGAISYFWTLPSGWGGTSTTNSITVTAGMVSDTVKVSAQFMCGSSIEVKKPVIVRPVPALTPTGIINICSGDSVTLSAGTGISYVWLQDGLPITGATSQFYKAYSAHRFSVIVTSAAGCTDTSAADTAMVHALPVPAITVSGVTLSTGSFASYQWNHNGIAITGATAASYIISITSGNYSVTVTDANGCSGTSANFDAATLGIDGANGGKGVINIYPNPTTDHLNITASEKVNIMISSINGRNLGYYENAKIIDVSNLAEGIYILRITDKQGGLLGTQKIVKYTGR